MNCIIPARKGFKRISWKNTQVICGKPMVFWTIDAAQKSKCFEQIIISTDDENLLEQCDKIDGLTAYNRPPELALDNSTMETTVLDVIKSFSSKSYALLQPTSPLRNSTHITNAKSLFEESKNGNLVSMNKVAMRPSLYYKKNNDGNIAQIFPGFSDKLQRQFNLTILKENGAIYMFES